VKKAVLPLRLVTQLTNAIAQPNTSAVFAVSCKEAMRRRFRNAELSENDGSISMRKNVPMNMFVRREAMRSECGGTMLRDFQPKA
jgi:hypothetical protein